MTPGDLAHELEPVAAALVAEARGDADQLLAAADREGAATVAAATREAEAMLAAARADGEAEARAVAATDRARARREARELVLAARRQAFERLRAEAREAAAALRHDAAYPQLLHGLATLARDQLGADAAVTLDGTVGGLEARVRNRSVDYRLPAIADRCVEALGAELETLWQ